MFLKRLEIQGFKSFAERTILEFLPPENGKFSITAVVGPNGSGKSNITDAIRWVMGEASMKTLRGKKSDDVIFSGSDAKGALSMAQVTMYLDNSTKTVPIEQEEITITRRIYRSGESEYLINNAPARLLDIRILLAQASFAEDAYTVVGQGMIDKLLTVGASERKDFFDEASGIKELQIKRHQSHLKLVRSEENIAQAETVFKEVEPRLKSLERQMKKLEERENLKIELCAHQETYYHLLRNQIHGEIDGLHKEMEKTNEVYTVHQTELETIQKSMAVLADEASRNDVFEGLQSEYRGKMQEKNTLELEVLRLETKMTAQYAEAGERDIPWMENKRRELKSRSDELSAELYKISENKENQSNDTLFHRTKLTKLLQERNVEATQLEVLQNRLMSAHSEQNMNQLTGLRALQTVLSVNNQFGHVHGVLAELGQVDEKYQLALEVAAGQYLTSVVVDESETARQLIDHVRREKAGIVTFLPMNKIRAREPLAHEYEYATRPGAIDWAVNLVHFSPELKSIFSFVLGSTLVVQDLQAAEQIGIGKVRMITLAGDLVEKTGVMKGGFRGKRSQVTFSGRLSFGDEQAIERAEQEIVAKKKRLFEIELEVEKIKEDVSLAQLEERAVQASEQRLAQEFTKIQDALQEVEQDINLLSGHPEKFGEKMIELQQKETELRNQITGVSTQIASISERIERFNEEGEQKRQQFFALQNRMQMAQNQVNAILEKKNNFQVALAKLEVREEELGKEVDEELGVSLASLIARHEIVHPQPEIAEILPRIQKIKYQLSLIGAIDEQAVVEYAETKQKYEFLESQIQDLTSAIKDLKKIITDLDNVMKKKRSEAFKQIRREFNRYFQILFEGGEASLEEVYSDENQTDGAGLEESTILSNEEEPYKRKQKILSGIDIIANPPGKKIKYLNALSGGERTLTSIALICAILHYNPSPFVVLDEVEAALDEANTQRFVRIMQELSTQSQFIVISHNRVTMQAANAIYGVVMNRDGMSKLVSVKLDQVKADGEVDAKAV